MTYSINTSKYTAKKVVDIDGTIFKVRPITTAEQFEIERHKKELDKAIKDEDIDNLELVYKKVTDVYFSLFDKTDTIKKIFKDIPVDKLAEIYQEIMENAGNDNEQ